MAQQITVIGGGLSGLTVATLLARGGRDVTLHEKAKLGGRATTTEFTDTVIEALEQAPTPTEGAAWIATP